MRKIAVISDIHANLSALKAVIEDICNVYGADEIYCLGDTTDGAPWHNEVLDLIRELQIPTIMGNHDERIAFDHEVFPLKKHTLEEQIARLDTINYTKTTITAENKAFLENLPKSICIEEGNISCLLVHGSPNSNEEYVYENHDEVLLKKMFETTNSDVIIAGHTHLSYIKNIESNNGRRESLYINAGSVGRSKEKDSGKAVYLWLTIDEDEVLPILRKIDYNIEETIIGIRESRVSNFYADFLQNQWEMNI